MISPMILESIKKELAARDWTNYRLAKEVERRGGSKDSIYRFLEGKRALHTDTLEIVCDVLGMALESAKKKKEKI